LWFDEAMSVHWARSSVPRILEVSMNLVEDRLPPLYYLLLHYWRSLFGDGEVAVRLLSVLLGTLLVPLVYRLSVELFDSDRRVALLAAALTTFNPFLVWYSQEARMYTLAALLATLGTWFFWRGCYSMGCGHLHLRAVQVWPQTNADNLLLRVRPRWSAFYWLAYGLCALAGLYTHLYTGFLLPAHALYLLLTYRRSRRAWLPFTLTMLAVAALFAPLALAALRVSREAGPGDPLTGFWARAWWLLGAFTVWKAFLSLPPLLSAAVTGIMIALAAVGLLAWQPSVVSYPLFAIRYPPSAIRHPPPAIRYPPSMLLVALSLLTPFVIATLLLFRNRVAFFGERYFIVMVPWLLIAVAAGTVYLANRFHTLLPTPYSLLPTPYSLLPMICYLLPVALTLLSLPGQWSPPARKEAWRETVGYLAAVARPDDAILIHPDWTRFPLQYYFRGPGQTYAVFNSVDDRTDLDGPLTVISHRHPVVWLVESHTELADPEHRVNAWLAARYPEVTALYPPGLVAVRAYVPGYLSDRLPDFATPTNVAFAGGLRLAGYAVPQTQVRATDDLFHPPSGWVHVTLYWTAGTMPLQDYTPFVRLIDGAGQVWGASLERPNDAFDFYPPTRWRPGQAVRADFDVNLNPATPPGRYTLVVGLRDASGAQVPLADGAPQASLATVEVVR
jgi:hypothetical protein